MFKIANSLDEIAASMEDNLVSEAVATRDISINKFAAAMDHLCAVAEIFDELGLSKEAEAATMLLEVIAKKKSKKPVKSKSSKSKSKGKKTMHKNKDLTPEKMIDNLKNKGWVFDEDCADVNDGDDNYLDFNIDLNDVKEGKKHTHGCMCGECVSEFHHGDDCICQVCNDGRTEDIVNSDDMFYADDESNDEKELAKMFEKMIGPVAKDVVINKRRHSSTMLPAMSPQAIKDMREHTGGHSLQHRDEERMEPLDKEIERYFGGSGDRENTSYENKRKELAKRELENGGPGATVAPARKNHRF